MDTNAETYSDYMLVLSPPDEVMEVIKKYKKATFRQIGEFESLYSTPHISVAYQHRQMPVTMHQKLDCYKRNLSRLPAINLYVNGFHFFKNDKTGMTIYARIEINNEVEGWFKELGKIFGDKKKVIPHIIVAKGLSPERFQLLWPKFINQQYQQAFKPQSITVLSKPMLGERKPWTPFRELYFNNFG